LLVEWLSDKTEEETIVSRSGCVICALLNGDLDCSKSLIGDLRLFSFPSKAIKAPDEKKPAFKAG
jgi:hypothetical protein